MEDFVEYPDPDSQEEEEVEDEIDTGKIQEAMEKTKEENPNPTDDGMEDFQKMLMGIFSQFMGADAQGGQPNPDMESFMREFQAGFASGAAASNQYAQTTAQSENATINPLFRFFFTASSGLSWAIAMCFLLSGYSGSKAIYGVLLTLCAARLAYLFLFANPEQVASLSSVPGILGWLLTLLNVVTGSAIGDWLGTIVDSAFFALKVFTRFRFHMFLSCWIIGYLPEVNWMSYLRLENANLLLLLFVVIASALVVLYLFVKERRKQRKNVLFLQNFLSVFTNPEMQESDIKEIIGSKNEIKDEARMKQIVIDAYALHKGIPRSDSETFVNMYFDRAVKEYNTIFVAPLL